MADLDRRRLLQVAGTAAGGLMIGFALGGAAKPAAAGRAGALSDTEPPEGSTEINAWIVIEPDESILLRLARAEMGQGIYTAMPMLLAEELECDWSKVKVEYASPLRNLQLKGVYGQMFTTGSASIRVGHATMQQAGANARMRLITAAAHRWKVDPSECFAASSRVQHRPTGRLLSYGQLAGEAAGITLDKNPPIKTPDQYKLVGKSIPRLETRVMVTGEAQFGIDTRLPGLVYAAVRMCPVFGGSLASHDQAAVLKRRGVIAVVPLPDGVAVVADNFWRAKEAAAALPITWNEGPGAAGDTPSFRAEYLEAAHTADMAIARNVGDAQSACDTGSPQEAVYEVPYLAHATMEPMNCTAWVKPDSVDIWIGTQWVERGMQVAAQAIGMKPEQIRIHNCFLGGGFGRRTYNDELPQAVLVSKAVGRPVKLIWTREDDMRHGRYRPQATAVMKATLADDGRPKAVWSRIAVPSLLVSTGWGKPQNGLEPWAADGLVNTPYDPPAAFRVEALLKNTHVPVLMWRAPAPSIHGFMLETFMDELAFAAGVDPYEYRRRMLTARPDVRAVLDEAAHRSNWGGAMPKGSGRGIALQEAMGSTTAEVAEVSVSPNGNLKVTRVVIAYDTGHVVHPKLVHMQLEGGVIFGLQAALYGKITIKDGRVEQGNFNNYRMVRMADCPKLECYPALSGGDKWGGAGETAVPGIAPAVGNAIFAATGKRIRSLPFSEAVLA